MPTQAEIVDELRRRATTPQQHEIVQELERRMGGSSSPTVPGFEAFAPGTMELGGAQSLARGIRSFLGGPEGTPAPAPELAPPGMAELMSLPPAVQKAGLVTGGALLAGPLAATTGMPLMAAESLAGVGAEALGQAATGQGGLVDLVLAGVGPPILRGILSGGREVLKQIGKRLPGAAGGLHEQAIEQSKGLIASLRPQDLEGLSSAAKALDNLSVPLQEFRKMANNIVSEELLKAPSLQSKAALKLIGELGDLINVTQNKALPLQQVRQNLESIGARIGELRRQQGIGATASTDTYNAFRGIYKSLLNDLDKLPPDAAGTLQQLRTSFRNDFGASDLENIFEKATEQRQIDGASYINWRKVNNALQKGKDAEFIKESFTPADLAKVEEFVQEKLRLPALPAPQGVNVGSALTLGRMGGVGAATFALTGNPALAAGATAVAAVAPRIVAKAMMSETGRTLLTRMLSEQPFLTPQAVQFLAAATRQALPSVDIPGLPGAGAPPPPGDTPDALPSGTSVPLPPGLLTR